VLSLGAEACGDKDDISAALLKMGGGVEDCEKMQLLLDAGADVNWKRADGQTPLCQAAMYSYNGSVDLLLRHKAQVDLPGKYSNLECTALIAAALSGKIETVRLLLEAGADRALKDDQGKTALHRAIEANKKEIVDLLRNWKPNASS
jgi:ankyrin repeat protein